MFCAVDSQNPFLLENVSYKFGINCISSPSNIYAMAEIELIDSLGNDTTNTIGGTAYAEPYNPIYPPANAFDNNNDTYWVSTSTDDGVRMPPVRIWFEFVQFVEIKKIAIRARPTFFRDTPLIFQLQSYDMVAQKWITLQTIVNEPDWTASERREYILQSNNAANFNGSIWGINVTASQNNTNDSAIAEIEWLENSVDKTGTGKAFATTYNLFDDAYNPNMAFDNNNATFWKNWAAKKPLPCAIWYSFGTVQKVTQVSIRARDDASFAEAPKNFDIIYFDFVNSEWVTVASFSNQTWTQGERKVFNFTNPFA